MKKKYIYDGLIKALGGNSENFKAETYAETKGKAKSNILFQYKKHKNLEQRCKVTMLGEVEEA